MKRKHIRLFTAVFAMVLASSAYIPQNRAAQEGQKAEQFEEQETDQEAEEERDECIEEEPAAGPEDPGISDDDGGSEEEAASGSGNLEEAPEESDVNPEETDASEPAKESESELKGNPEETAEEAGINLEEDVSEGSSKDADLEETDASETIEEPGSKEGMETGGRTESQKSTEDEAAKEKKKSGKKKKKAAAASSEITTEENKDTKTEAESESESEESKKDEAAYSSSNAGTYWDSSWYVQSDFRFTQVDKVPVLSEGEISGISVFSSMDEDKTEIGILPYFSLAYVLKDDLDDDWLYVESGDVRGFVKAEELADQSYTEELIDEIGEDHFSSGVMTCEKADNKAYTYTKTTVYEVLADKVYAVSLVKGDIYEYPSFSSRAVGSAASGTLAYVLEDNGEGWLYIESDDVRGFIPSSSLLSGSIAEDIVEEIGEEEIAKATQLIDPEENRSLYYTLKSVKTASDGTGEAIAEYALSLVGSTKYVWGGTSLVFGADCSGFTQSVFASFGINIPRLAEDQGASGEPVESLAEAKPGDIVYYASGPHVGIYIGNGQVVQCSGSSRNTAQNPGRGATVSNADYMPITSIRRYIIPTTERTGSNNADPTQYTQEQLELIWAIVAQEDNGSYEGALAVISSAMNRADSPRWASCGSNALEQLTAPGQYCYSIDTYWQARLGGNVPDYVKQAVSDCLDKGVRNHSYTSFRSYYTAGSVQIGGGNYYFS